MKNSNEIISGNDVPEIWAKLFLRAMQRGVDSLGPTMLTIQTDDAPSMVEKDHPLRRAIDSVLQQGNNPRVKETAGIIFPFRAWNTRKPGIEDLTSWYTKDFMPRLRDTAPAMLRNTYFERMVDFTGEGTEGKPGNNQLKFIIDLCTEASKRGTHFRQSGLQVSIFDPIRDHTRSAQKNFPCLQQVGFHFCEDGSLGLSAYYPTQFIVERAYGNYLGLCQLGVFMAHEIGVHFREFVCFVGSPRLGKMAKSQLRDLEQICSIISGS